MSLALSWGLSMATGAQVPPCTAQIRLQASQEAAIRMSSCCEHEFKICMRQGADKSFALVDADTADFTGASEVMFKVWRNGVSGTLLLTYTMTGGEITIPADNRIAFDVPNADSATLAAGNLYAELFVFFADGTQLCETGKFTVGNTRSLD